MKLCSITLKNFRSYEDKTFEFGDNVTLITGPNGVGKTNLLEAVYVLYTGKSFRDSDELLTRHGQNWWRVVGEFDDGSTREVRFQLDLPCPKQLIINGVSKGRISQADTLPVVLFEPDDLYMVHASPQIRRNYIDSLLTTVQVEYGKFIRRYERALQQRNRLLKNSRDRHNVTDSVFVWDVALAEYGSRVVEYRKTLVGELNRSLSNFYSLLSGVKTDITVQYVTNASTSSHQLLKKITRSLTKDLYRGSTSVGPHRDDIVFLMNGNDMREVSSRGEVRMLLLSLKQFAFFYQQQLRQKVPIVLLDDVFSELDIQRQHNHNELFKKSQACATATHIPFDLDAKDKSTVCIKF